MTGIVMLYSTFPTKETVVAAARALLEQHLIACANIVDGVTSLYRWEGKLQQEGEVLLLAKMRADMADKAIAALKALHP